MVEYLIHYTDFKGLQGVLESNSLWATDFRYLNDSRELIIAEEILAGEIQKIHRKKFLQEYEAFTQEAEQQCKDIAEILIGNLYNLRNFFVVSFALCPKVQFLFEALRGGPKEIFHGRLDMWRGYGKPDGRFGIVFDKDKLDNFFRVFEQSLKAYENGNLNEFYSFNSVIYRNEKEKIREEINDEMVRTIEILLEGQSEENTIEFKELIKTSLPEFIRL